MRTEPVPMPMRAAPSRLPRVARFRPQCPPRPCICHAGGIVQRERTGVRMARVEDHILDPGGGFHARRGSDPVVRGAARRPGRSVTRATAAIPPFEHQNLSHAADRAFLRNFPTARHSQPSRCRWADAVPHWRRPPAAPSPSRGPASEMRMKRATENFMRAPFTAYREHPAACPVVHRTTPPRDPPFARPRPLRRA